MLYVLEDRVDGRSWFYVADPFNSTVVHGDERRLDESAEPVVVHVGDKFKPVAAIVGETPTSLHAIEELQSVVEAMADGGVFGTAFDRSGAMALGVASSLDRVPCGACLRLLEQGGGVRDRVSFTGRSCARCDALIGRMEDCQASAYGVAARRERLAGF